MIEPQRGSVVELSANGVVVQYCFLGYTVDPSADPRQMDFGWRLQQIPGNIETTVYVSTLQRPDEVWTLTGGIQLPVV